MTSVCLIRTLNLGAFGPASVLRRARAVLPAEVGMPGAPDVPSQDPGLA